MDLVSELMATGFAKVIVLNGSECDYPMLGSILLALWPYEAEKQPTTRDAWIHPYYFASQQAYEAATSVARKHIDEGVEWREDIRLKPIFARLACFSQGRNTLSYTKEYGSRFHVQILTVRTALPATDHLQQKDNLLHCGDCHLCEAVCPVNALEGGIFHRDRCLRNWQIGGQIYPETVRVNMGNRLIGCDECQRCCPHNKPPIGETHPGFPVEDILENPKESAKVLRAHIGATITMANRLLGGACVIAGSTNRVDLLGSLLPLTESPSNAVAEHASWAAEQLNDIKL